MSDVRLVFRRLGRRPGPVFLAVLAVALGIGFLAAAFSILWGSTLKSLPCKEPERLMFVGRLPGTGVTKGIRPAELREWSQSQRSFSDLVAWLGADVVLTGDGAAAEGAHAAYVSFPFFRALGAQPALGRSFLPQEDLPGSPPSVILGHDLWVRRYHGNPAILGRVVRVGGEAATIVGVMPKEFRFPVDQDLWLPLGGVLAYLEERETPLDCFGRLRPGVPADAARSELAALSRRAGLSQEGGPALLVMPYIRAYAGSAEHSLWLMMAAGVGVLLIACTNVSCLLLAQTVQREQDLAVRFALGAQRRQIFRVILLESFCIAALGALGGVGVAAGCISIYERTGGLVQAFWVDVRLHGEALGFAAAAAGATALLAGAVPALRATRSDVRRTLQDGSPASTSLTLGRWGKTLVTTQIALSCGLLVVSGQTIESLRNLYRHDFGAAPDRVWTALLMLDPSRAPSAPDWLKLYSELAPALSSIPGVRAVAFTSHLPAGRTPRSTFEIDGSPGIEEPTTRWAVVSPGFFSVLGRPVLQGRDFAPSDTGETAPVVLVNRSFAARYFPASNPIGRRLRLRDPRLPASWATIVGVVPDLFVSWDYFSDRIDSLHPEGLYIPMAQSPRPGLYVMVKTEAPLKPLMPELRKAIAKVDPNVPPLQAQPLSEAIRQAMSPYRQVRSMFTVLGLVALLLTAVGLYGTVSFTASQRRREMALRLAMGASPGKLMRLVIGEGVQQVAWGSLAGGALALIMSRLLGSLLFGVRPGEPLAFGAAMAVLFAVALLACFLPALRAARVAPARTLRAD